MTRAFAGAILAVLVAAPAFAQSSGDPIRKGSIEVGGASAFTFTHTTFGSSENLPCAFPGCATDGSSHEASSTVLLLNGTTAYYLSPRIGVGGMVGILHLGVPDTFDTADFGLTATQIGGLIKVRFPMGEKAEKPKDFYVLGTAGVSIFSFGGSGSVSGPAFSIGAGADIFMSRQIAFNVGAQFQHASLGGVGASGIAIAVGLTLVLK
jgi:hypothetical protein